MTNRKISVYHKIINVITPQSFSEKVVLFTFSTKVNNKPQYTGGQYTGGFGRGWAVAKDYAKKKIDKKHAASEKQKQDALNKLNNEQKSKKAKEEADKKTEERNEKKKTATEEEKQKIAEQEKLAQQQKKLNTSAENIKKKADKEAKETSLLKEKELKNPGFLENIKKKQEDRINNLKIFEDSLNNEENKKKPLFKTRLKLAQFTKFDPVTETFNQKDAPDLLKKKISAQLQNETAVHATNTFNKNIIQDFADSLREYNFFDEAAELETMSMTDLIQDNQIFDALLSSAYKCGLIEQIQITYPAEPDEEGYPQMFIMGKNLEWTLVRTSSSSEQLKAMMDDYYYLIYSNTVEGHPGLVATGPFKHFLILYHEHLLNHFMPGYLKDLHSAYGVLFALRTANPKITENTKNTFLDHIGSNLGLTGPKEDADRLLYAPSSKDALNCFTCFLPTSSLVPLPKNVAGKYSTIIPQLANKIIAYAPEMIYHSHLNTQETKSQLLLAHVPLVHPSIEKYREFQKKLAEKVTNKEIVNVVQSEPELKNVSEENPHPKGILPVVLIHPTTKRPFVSLQQVTPIEEEYAKKFQPVTKMSENLEIEYQSSKTLIEDLQGNTQAQLYSLYDSLYGPKETFQIEQKQSDDLPKEDNNAFALNKKNKDILLEPESNTKQTLTTTTTKSVFDMFGGEKRTTITHTTTVTGPASTNADNIHALTPEFRKLIQHISPQNPSVSSTKITEETVVKPPTPKYPYTPGTWATETVREYVEKRQKETQEKNKQIMPKKNNDSFVDSE